MPVSRFIKRKVLLIITIVAVLVSPLLAQTKYVKANGITLAYESFGQPGDETILLIAGTGSQLVDWPVAFCKQLADAGYQVIRFDNRDIGLSTKLDSLGAPDWVSIFPFIKKCEPAPLPYTLMDMANDASSLLEGLKIQQAHVVGVSMGGAIAQLLTIHHPEKVKTLTCLMASTGNPNLPPAEESAMKAMGTPPPNTNNADTLAAYLVNIYKTLGTLDGDALLKERALLNVNRAWHPEGAARQAAAVIIGDNCDRREQLSKIKVPVTVIHGDIDPLVKVAAGKELAATIPGTRLILIPGMGHAVSNQFVKTIADGIIANARSAK